MGERLVIKVIANGKQMFNMYWHWSAYCSTEFEYKCRLLDILDADDDLETMLSKVVNEFPNSGLATNKSWWDEGFATGRISPLYDEEIRAVNKMVDNGIPVGQDRNEGLICITPYAMDHAEGWAEWATELDLDEPDFMLMDTLWVCEDPEDYADDEVNDMPVEMRSEVTKENAREMAGFIYQINDGYYRDPISNVVYQLI